MCLLVSVGVCVGLSVGVCSVRTWCVCWCGRIGVCDGVYMLGCVLERVCFGECVLVCVGVCVLVCMCVSVRRRV